MIAGQGVLQEEYERQIESYGLQSNIKLLGYRTDIDELCGIADCFVHTAFQEGLSVALLEAMASGLPIIGSDVRGVRDLVAHNQGGFCVNPKAADEVQNAIRRMYEDESVRTVYGFYNTETVKKYCIENINEIIKKEYLFEGHIAALIEAVRRKRALGIDEKDFVLISVGELNRNKNHEAIIKALAELKNPCIKYIICGQGRLEDYLRLLIKQNYLEKQVLLLGYRTDVRELLRISDLFVFPSKREGLSVSLMEAMAVGLPAICGDIRGNRDLIEDDRGGYLITGNNVHEYSDAIRNLMDENGKKEMMGKYNHAKMGLFDSEIINISMRQLYEWNGIRAEV